ncbi:hypothetical protein PAPYR_6173 [Paratrimastix pyriformis]|uniref:Uncharacterized protein n=1 Tax=Paratrimastix pyriformis TaxID=342808 RepID=A0ABQ8UKH4_9EUKA|nr:hypothetical protein PAPYR_6173 [Paratrimastix pyriformis]
MEVVLGIHYNRIASHAQHHFVRMLLKGQQLPDAVINGVKPGPGYSLSGKAFDLDSSYAARNLSEAQRLDLADKITPETEKQFFASSLTVEGVRRPKVGALHFCLQYHPTPDLQKARKKRCDAGRPKKPAPCDVPSAPAPGAPPDGAAPTTAPAAATVAAMATAATSPSSSQAPAPAQDERQVLESLETQGPKKGKKGKKRSEPELGYDAPEVAVPISEVAPVPQQPCEPLPYRTVQELRQLRDSGTWDPHPLVGNGAATRHQRGRGSQGSRGKARTRRPGLDWCDDSDSTGSTGSGEGGEGTSGPDADYLLALQLQFGDSPLPGSPPASSAPSASRVGSQALLGPGSPVRPFARPPGRPPRKRMSNSCGRVGSAASGVMHPVASSSSSSSSTGSQSSSSESEGPNPASAESGASVAPAETAASRASSTPAPSLPQKRDRGKPTTAGSMSDRPSPYLHHQPSPQPAVISPHELLSPKPPVAQWGPLTALGIVAGADATPEPSRQRDETSADARPPLPAQSLGEAPAPTSNTLTPSLAATPDAPPHDLTPQLRAAATPQTPAGSQLFHAESLPSVWNDLGQPRSAPGQERCARPSTASAGTPHTTTV